MTAASPQHAQPPAPSTAPAPGTVRKVRPTRADYVAWRTITTRWRDDDAYGHLNNATYYELFDTAVNAHLFEATGTNVRLLPQIGVVAETSCRYFRELGFPEPIETGVVVDRIGRSSIVWRIGLFQGDSDEAAAEGRFVHVYVDNTHGAGNRPVAPIPDVVRAAVEPLLRAPGQG